MDSSLRLLGIFVSGLAMICCLATCSLPDLPAADEPTKRCHTEKEDSQKQSEEQKLCCSGEAILPSAETTFSFVADGQPLTQYAVSTVGGVAYATRAIHFFPDSSPPIRTVLRI